MGKQHECIPWGKQIIHETVFETLVESGETAEEANKILTDMEDELHGFYAYAGDKR